MFADITQFVATMAAIAVVARAAVLSVHPACRLCNATLGYAVAMGGRTMMHDGLLWPSAVSLCDRGFAHLMSSIMPQLIVAWSSVAGPQRNRHILKNLAEPIKC